LVIESASCPFTNCDKTAKQKGNKRYLTTDINKKLKVLIIERVFYLNGCKIKQTLNECNF